MKSWLETKEIEVFCGMTQTLIDGALGTTTGRISSSFPNPHIHDKSISQMFEDDCEFGVVENFRFYVDDVPYTPATTPTKVKKAQWKNERSVFNRVNQGKKSK